MTFSKLLEMLNSMSDEQKAMPAIVHAEGEYLELSMVSEIAYADTPDEGEPFEVGQPILS
jgi:hypothetical protein